MEEFLDEAYERFVARKEGSTKQRKRAKQAYEKDQLLEVQNPKLWVSLLMDFCTYLFFIYVILLSGQTDFTDDILLLQTFYS